MGRRKWTREAIIAEIQKLHEAGESLSTRNMNELGYSGMVTTAYKEEFFRGWWNAVEAAELDPKKVCRRRRKWTKETIIRRIQELHGAGADLSHSAAKRDHQYLVVVAVDPRFFGNWRTAIAAAGLDYQEVSKHESWSRERIAAEIRRLHEAGKALNHEEAKRKYSSLVSAAASKRYFGSWAAAVTAAGVDYHSVCRIRRWTRESIVDTIRELNAGGHAVNNSNMRRLGYRGMMEAACRDANFGSWAEAVRAAGLDYEEIRKV